jgi:OOP family OmpA-OmpF porin
MFKSANSVSKGYTQGPKAVLRFLGKANLVLMGLATAVVMAQTREGSSANAMGLREGRAASIEALGVPFNAGYPISTSQARVVVYRQENSALMGATSILVNGVYHASLVKGAYSEFCYQTGKFNLSFRQAHVGTQAKDEADSTVTLELEGSKTYFVRVAEKSGRPAVELLPAALAQQELTSKRLQVHTISRLAQACIQASAGPGPVAVAVATEFVAGQAEPKGHPSMSPKLASHRANAVGLYSQTTGRETSPTAALSLTTMARDR